MKSIYGKYFKIGIIFWSICFIVLLLSYLVVLAPQEKLRHATESKLTEIKRLAQSARESAEQRNRTKLLKQLTDSGNRLKDFVVEQGNAANLTFDISRISGRVELNSFSSSFISGERTLKTDKYKHIITRQISVNFNSSFNKFAMFLNALERRRPVIFIDTFSITRSTEDNSGNKVDMKLAVLVEKEAKTTKPKGVDG